MKLSLKLTLKSLLSYGIILGNKIANIIYNMNAFNVTATGTRTINNAGSDGDNSDADIYGSNLLSLSNVLSRSFEADIPYTLGSELTTSLGAVVSTGDEISSYTKNSETSFDLAVTTVGTNDARPALNNTIDTTVIGNTYIVTFDAVVNSGTPTIYYINAGDGHTLIAYTIVNGHNEISITATEAVTAQIMYFDGRNLFDISITNWSQKQLSNPNSYLNYFDQATKAIVSIDNSLSTPSTTYTMDVPLQNVFATSDQITATHKAYMEANPEAIVSKVLYDNVPELDFTIGLNGNGDKIWYPCNEGEASGAYVQNVGVPLGSELLIGTWSTPDAGCTVTDNLDGTFTLAYDGTSAGTKRFKRDSSGHLDEILRSFGTVELLSGTTNILEFFPYSYIAGEGLILNDVVTTNTYSIVASPSVDWASFQLKFDGTSAFSIKFYDYSVKEASAKEIQNYNVACWTDFKNVNYGMTNRALKRDATGLITGIADASTAEYHGDGSSDTIATRTYTADISIEITPRVVESILLVNTTTGDITMNTNGTVTASSGAVGIDTTTLQVGVKSIITVAGISISGISTLFENLDGTVHNYTEDKA